MLFRINLTTILVNFGSVEIPIFIQSELIYKYYNICFLSFVSFICRFVLLLLFIPLNFLFSTLFTPSTWFLNLYTCGLNIVLHFDLYIPFFCLVFTGFCGNVVVSSTIVCFISFVSYALFANMYIGLCDLIALIVLIAKFVSYFGPFVALWCLINSYSEFTVMWFLM